jgi:hypothetical protein
MFDPLVQVLNPSVQFQLNILLSGSQYLSRIFPIRGIASLIATHILASSDYTAIFAISLADLYP